jgi:hypothetical protein
MLLPWLHRLAPAAFSFFVQFQKLVLPDLGAVLPALLIFYSSLNQINDAFSIAIAKKIMREEKTQGKY